MTNKNIKRIKLCASDEDLFMSTVEDRNGNSLKRLSNEFQFESGFGEQHTLRKRENILSQLDKENDDIEANILILLEEIEKTQENIGQDSHSEINFEEKQKGQCSQFQQSGLRQAFQVIKNMIQLLRSKTKTIILISKILKAKDLEIKEMSEQLKHTVQLSKKVNAEHLMCLQSVFSYQFQNNQSLKLSTEFTESDDTLPISSQMIFQPNQGLNNYIASLSHVENDVFYEDNLIQDLENIGDNNRSLKVIARLLKEHRCLKLCLSQVFERQEEHEKVNNKRILQLYAKKHSNKKSSKESECLIY